MSCVLFCFVFVLFDQQQRRRQHGDAVHPDPQGRPRPRRKAADRCVSNRNHNPKITSYHDCNPRALQCSAMPNYYREILPLASVLGLILFLFLFLTCCASSCGVSLHYTHIYIYNIYHVCGTIYNDIYKCIYIYNMMMISRGGLWEVFRAAVLRRPRRPGHAHSKL